MELDKLELSRPPEENEISHFYFALKLTIHI